MAGRHICVENRALQKTQITSSSSAQWVVSNKSHSDIFKLCRDRTPPVSPKILSRSGGVRMSLPTTDFLKPGAYFSTQSNAAEADKWVCHRHMFIKCYSHIHTLSQIVADVVDNCVIPVSA